MISFCRGLFVETCMKRAPPAAQSNGGKMEAALSAGLVTIVIPIYKRLSYLPEVLQAVEAQDYPDIELIVSDNGQNGDAIENIVGRCYSRPHRVRHTAVTVPIPAHYHQVLHEAKGTYFIWLCDDDLISRNFVSELVGILDRHPEASAAIAREEVINSAGEILRSSSDQVPAFLPGEDFIRAWNAYKYENYATILARTRDIRACGGFGEFPWGTASDDFLLTKLCLRGSVAFGQRCTFHYRWDEASFGFAMSAQKLAEDYRGLLRALATDPVILDYQSRNPVVWGELKQRIVRMTWREYRHRWDTMYRKRLDLFPWIRAAFAVPFPLEYYCAIFTALWYGVKGALFDQAKGRLQWLYRLYQACKG